jgi:hypothetical protein
VNSGRLKPSIVTPLAILFSFSLGELSQLSLSAPQNKNKSLNQPWLVNALTIGPAPAKVGLNCQAVRLPGTMFLP